MTERELRCSDLPAEWIERLARRACPVCGKEREDFDGRHRGYQKPPHYNDPTWYGGTPCCRSECTTTYWAAHKTWQEHRRKIFEERGGICAGCGIDLYMYPPGDKRRRFALVNDWTLDHILPIALGGSMWSSSNHQILCSSCNKVKTARDLANIAAWKRMKDIVLPDFTTIILEAERYRPEVQKTLFN